MQMACLFYYATNKLEIMIDTKTINKYIKIVHNNNNSFLSVMTKLNNKYAASNHKNAVQSHHQLSKAHGDYNSKTANERQQQKANSAPNKCIVIKNFYANQYHHYFTCHQHCFSYESNVTVNRRCNKYSDMLNLPPHRLPLH